MAKIDTLFLTKTASEKTLWGRTYLYSPYKGVPEGVSIMVLKFIFWGGLDEECWDLK